MCRSTQNHAMAWLEGLLLSSGVGSTELQGDAAPSLSRRAAEASIDRAAGRRGTAPDAEGSGERGNILIASKLGGGIGRTP